MNWRSIDTAPKDGTQILLYFEDIGVHEGCWWKDPDCDCCEPYWMRRGMCFECEPEVPTHWMPLPDPPK